MNSQVLHRANVTGTLSPQPQKTAAGFGSPTSQARKRPAAMPALFLCPQAAGTCVQRGSLYGGRRGGPSGRRILWPGLPTLRRPSPGLEARRRTPTTSQESAMCNTASAPALKIEQRHSLLGPHALVIPRDRAPDAVYNRLNSAQALLTVLVDAHSAYPTNGLPTAGEVESALCLVTDLINQAEQITQQLLNQPHPSEVAA